MPIMSDKDLAKGFLKGLEPMAAAMLVAFVAERGKTASDEEMQDTYDTVICLSGAMSMKRSADALESIKKVVASYALMQALADPKNRPIIEEMQAKRDAMLGAGTTPKLEGPTQEGPKNAS